MEILSAYCGYFSFDDMYFNRENNSQPFSFRLFCIDIEGEIEI